MKEKGRDHSRAAESIMSRRERAEGEGTWGKPRAHPGYIAGSLRLKMALNGNDATCSLLTLNPTDMQERQRGPLHRQAPRERLCLAKMRVYPWWLLTPAANTAQQLLGWELKFPGKLPPASATFIFFSGFLGLWICQLKSIVTPNCHKLKLFLSFSSWTTTVSPEFTPISGRIHFEVQYGINMHSFPALRLQQVDKKEIHQT